MKRWMLVLGVASLFASGCVKQYRDTTLYQRSGRQKAIVAVLPVMNHVENTNLSWDLSREFTDEIRQRVYASPKIYLLREGGSEALAEQLNVPDPRKLSPSAAEHLGPAEFAVVAELIDQQQTPHSADHPAMFSRKNTRDEAASLALRLRVLDLRHGIPRVILQEILSHESEIARAYLDQDYEKIPWGHESFSRTPLGMAHARLIREAVARVESYIEATR